MGGSKIRCIRSLSAGCEKVFYEFGFIEKMRRKIMKRDWDMIRDIMVRCKEKPDVGEPLQLGNWPENIHPEISYHVKMLLDKDYLEGKMEKTIGPGPDNFFIYQLTWEGHDYLDFIS